MKKTLTLVCLLALTVFTFGASAPSATTEAGSDIGLSVNGQTVTFSSMPFLIDNTLMVPFRDLSESLGVQIDWDGNAQSAAAIKGDRTIKLTINSVQALRGEATVKLDAAPRLQDNKLFVPLRFFSESFAFNVYWDGMNKTVAIVDADKSLPTVGSMENLQQLFKDNIASDGSGGGSGGFIASDSRIMLDNSVTSTTKSAMPQAKESSSAGSSAATPAPPMAPTAAGAAPQGTTASNPDYSGTNVQVEGVDEADIIKTDGSYIYQVNRNRIIIAAAFPADQMKVTQVLTFEDKNFRANELYIDDKHMVVIGTSSYRNSDVIVPMEKPVAPTSSPASAPGSESSAPAVPAATSGSQPSASTAPAATSGPQPSVSVSPASPPSIMPMPMPMPEVSRVAVMPIVATKNTTKAIVYELGDRTQVKKLREVELDGRYVSSRKVGSSLYLVANKGFNIYPMLRGDLSPADKEAAMMGSMPSYKDTAAGDSFISIGYEDIRYFPNSIQSNYLMVAGFNISLPDQKVHVSSYLGSGQQVYASQANLYVTTNEYSPVVNQPADGPTPLTKQRVMIGENNSVIYKFAMDQGAIRYTGRGKVPGRAINQFAMDEHNGNFRIATTTGFAASSGDFTSANHMYVLNESMNVIGQIDDIAPGEQIYSVRYAGDRAYMVTFKTVDPLFVIDLQEPQAPQILGKLKIPGYSNYLHPYDETHLIGFGKDAIEVSSNNGPNANGVPPTTAYYQGMKMAMFDVSDVANPKEMFAESIGDRGTDSELLRNHKALLFSKEKNMLAFPVSLMETSATTGTDSNSIAAPGSSSKIAASSALRYGNFTFQGAFVYNVDLINGFKLKGKITHLTETDYLKSGQTAYNGKRNIQRILYIGDALYTASEQILKATDINSMNDLKSITLP
jgi:inhibitor of cysteine peptidase